MTEYEMIQYMERTKHLRDQLEQETTSDNDDVKQYEEELSKELDHEAAAGIGTFAANLAEANQAGIVVVG